MRISYALALLASCALFGTGEARPFPARGAGSTFDAILPIARRENVGVINWGLVDGREQTRLPWESWKRPYTNEEPVAWHHDLLHAEGARYRSAKIALIHEAGSVPHPTSRE